ncbi:MAG TPA: SDR family NAD(P)-dependent oxidoreductase, partial [Acidimicrobiia bacterium]|nr:SDR family NAD(P)-dependent oxidoreductase [Acidimicrobiia bacterium]
PDAFALMVDVNVKGTFNTIHATQGLLRAETGYVVAVSSVAAAARVVGFGGYIATKAATVDALVKGVDRRAVRIAHPTYIAPVLGLRTLLWRADARRTAKGAPKIIAAYDGTDAIHDRTAALLKSPE